MILSSITQFIPLWALFGLGAAVLSSAVLLTQEKLKGPGYAVAYWNKIVVFVLCLPFIFLWGVPQTPFFYVAAIANGAIWAIGDVILFSNIASRGAGPVSRLPPLSVFMTFLLWFLFDPALLQQYLDTPIRSGLIVLVLLASAYFTMKLKNCTVSWDTLRAMWFIIVAAVISPLIIKAAFIDSDLEGVQKVVPFMFFEGCTMLVLWTVFYTIRKPYPLQHFIAKETVRTGLIVGTILAVSVLMNLAGYYYADNPGLVPAVKFLDSVIILIVYKIIGRKEKADVKTGLAVLACAAMLIVLKSGVGQ